MPHDRPATSSAHVPLAGKLLIVTGLALALFEATVPHPMPSHVVPVVLAVLGLFYGSAIIDPENSTDYLVVVIAVGGAAATDALSHVYVIGPYLDAMLDLLCIALYSSAVAVLATRTAHRLSRSRRGSFHAAENDPPGE